MLLGARVLFSGKAQGISAKSYIQDGLIAMWDGIENAGWGIHNPNATILKDLVGSYDINLPSSAIVNDNHILLKDENAQSSNLFRIDTNSDYAVEQVLMYGVEEDAVTWGSWTIGRLFGGSYASQYWNAGRVWIGLRVFNTPGNSNIPGILTPYKHRIPLQASYNIRQGDSVFDIYFYYNEESYFDNATGTRKEDYQVALVPNGVHHYTYSMRLYNRTLTDAERLHNYTIDQQRFGV